MQQRSRQRAQYAQKPQAGDLEELRGRPDVHFPMLLLLLISHMHTHAHSHIFTPILAGPDFELSSSRVLVFVFRIMESSSKSLLQSSPFSHPPLQTA